MQNAKCKMQNSGFSVFEILVVVTLFMGVVTIASQAFFSTLKSQSKNEVQTKVKQNANFIVATLERAIHSATSIGTCTTTSITYLDNLGAQQTFACAGNTLTHKGSAVAGTEVVVSSCNFSCTLEGGTQTVNVSATVSITGANMTVEEQASTQIQTKIRLRN